jgi:hypothetical protein
MMDFHTRLCLLAAAAGLAAGSTFAQGTDPTHIQRPPLHLAQSQPTPEQPPQNLSEKLNQSNGVIHPKEVDPAIEKPAPKAGDPNVVPPPGTSGGADAPKPK